MADLSIVPGGELVTYGETLPIALVIADSAHHRAEAVDALALAGCAARGPIGFDEAARDFSRYDGLDLVVIEAASAPEALLERVFARAETLARERQLGIVATILPEQIDGAAAQLLGSHAQLLCDPTKAERVGAIAMSTMRGGRAVREVSGEAAVAQLRRLNEEMARIAETLVRLTRETDGPSAIDHRTGVRDSGNAYRGPETAAPIEIAASEIRGVIRARRLRSQFFEADLFADPAWDMLLDLFASDLERRRVSVSSLCIAAAVPPTTALRWIGTLHEAGLFERQADPADRRRAYIALTAKAIEGMRAYVGAIRRAGLSLV
ncbi:winged helix DNA-binding protein [Sphingomonas sp. MMS12-HWE2-04]|uniref:winged helix DNA-binding protein n=1 Tax=Sphingomonas sp. MMS12-HWE2-04 TaxID=3234199 RepID=UPI0038501FDD